MIYQDELYHYGVLGMKWGVTHNHSRALKRSAKHLKRIDKRKEKFLERAIDRKKKAKQQLSSAIETKDRKKIYKGHKAVLKSNRFFMQMTKNRISLTKYQEFFVKEMEKNFADIPVSILSRRSKRIGKEYLYMFRDS